MLHHGALAAPWHPHVHAWPRCAVMGCPGSSAGSSGLPHGDGHPQPQLNQPLPFASGHLLPADTVPIPDDGAAAHDKNCGALAGTPARRWQFVFLAAVCPPDRPSPECRGQRSSHQECCCCCPRCAQVPASTALFWMSPPPRHAIKAPTYVDLPTEWIRLYVRTAVDLGFMKPSGPAYYIDLNSIAFGE